MLTGVTIENYRGFQKYRLSDLTAVNLLVGKNNSGKTAVLESIHLLASGGDPMVLRSTANRRGEVVAATADERASIDVSHFFHGHDITLGSVFKIKGHNGMPPVSVEATPIDELEAQSGLFADFPPDRAAFALKIDGWHSRSKAEGPLVVSEEGALLPMRSQTRRPFTEQGMRMGSTVVFITPDSFEPESLSSMWNQVIRDKQENAVVKAMKILEPKLEDIMFQTGDRVPRPYAWFFSGRSAVLASVEGDRRRVPLGSMGDGMRRLLTLAISLNHARGGYLLIDEIDTGLHYSIMSKMWELVVITAKESNIQVFATTHSADCVRGLGLLCKRIPDLQHSVSAHKIEREMYESVPFSGAEVLNAVEHDIEIR